MHRASLAAGPRLALLSLTAFALAASPGDARGAPGAEDRWPRALGGDSPVDDAALSPYFPTGPLAEATRHLAAGENHQAWERLNRAAKSPELETPPGRFLRARVLIALGRSVDGARELEALAPDYPQLGTRCLCLAAAAYDAAGDLAGAARTWPACVNDPMGGRAARVAWARTLSRQSERSRALEVLEPALARGSSEALLLAGEIHEERGDLPRALQLYRRAYVEEPTSGAAGRAGQRARALSARLKLPLLEPAQRLERAERLFTGGDARTAQDELNAARIAPVCAKGTCSYARCPAPAGEGLPPGQFVLPRPAADAEPYSLLDARDDEASFDEPRPLPACADPVRREALADSLSCRAALLDARLARKAKRNTHALETARLAYERCEDGDLRARLLFVAQGAAAAVGDPEAPALALLLSLKFPEHALADDALLAAAQHQADRGNPAGERDLLRRLVRIHQWGDQRAEGLFRLFWSHRRQGHPERGLEYLLTLREDYEAGRRGDGADSERGRYWWGRTVAETAAGSDRALGREALRRLAQDRPLTYYGLLARAWLETSAPDVLAGSLPPPPVDVGDALRPGQLASDVSFLAAIELLRLGFVDEARTALALVDVRSLPRERKRGRESHVLVAELIARTGDLRGAHAIIRRDLPAYIRRGDRPLAVRASRLAYPLAYREHISAHASPAGIAADFMQGLMREESALDPRARSPVGARGLTQLMPATARQVASALGIARFDVEQLWDPDINIRIGSTYLGQMLRKFGHPGLAAAAYNAGPGAVSRWLAARGHAPLDEFVEDIPYAETRGYVKRVLRSYATYRYLYGEPANRLLSVKLSLRGDKGPAEAARE